MRRAPAALALLALLALPALPGCVVEGTWLRPDYEQTDKRTLKRVVVLTRVPEGHPAEVTPLAGRMARRFANLKTDLIVLRDEPAPEQGGRPLAEALEGADGALRIVVTDLVLEGDEAEARLEASLVRKDGETLVWRAAGSLSEDQDIEDLAGLQRRYVRELGEGVRPYVGPLFLLTRAVLASLPSPLLDDEDVMEKIELED